MGCSREGQKPKDIKNLFTSILCYEGTILSNRLGNLVGGGLIEQEERTGEIGKVSRDIRANGVIT